MKDSDSYTEFFGNLTDEEIEVLSLKVYLRFLFKVESHNRHTAAALLEILDNW